MAVIDVWYDPARGIGSTALDSYLAEFVGERSRMNMLMMEQRLKEADPTFLNEEILALNDQLGRLYEARAEIIRTQETGRLNVFNSLAEGEMDLRQVEMDGRVENAKIQGQLQEARMEERGKAYGKRQDQEQDYRSSLELTDRDAGLAIDRAIDTAVRRPSDEEAYNYLSFGERAVAAELDVPLGDQRQNDIIQYQIYQRLLERSQTDPANAEKYLDLADAVRIDPTGPFGRNDPDLVMQDKYGVMPEEEFREDVDWITQGGAGVNLGDYERTPFDELQRTAGLGSPYETEGIDQQIAALQAQIRQAEAQKAALPKPEDVLFRGVTGNYLLDPVFTSAHSDQRYIEQAETLSPMERKDSLSYMATTDSPMEAVYKARDMGGLVDTTQNVAAIQDVGTLMGVDAIVYNKADEVRLLLSADPPQLDLALAAYEDLSQTIENLPPELKQVYLLEIEGAKVRQLDGTLKDGNAIGLLITNYEDAVQRREAGDPDWGDELKEGADGITQLVAFHSTRTNDGGTPPALWLSDEIARLEEMRRAGDEVGYFEGIDALYSQVSAMDPALLGESGDAFLRMVESGRESGDGSLMAANILNLGRHTQNTYFDITATIPGVDEDPESFDPDREEREAMRVGVELDAPPPEGSLAGMVAGAAGLRPPEAGVTSDIPLGGEDWGPTDLYLKGKTKEVVAGSGLEEPEAWVEDPGSLPDLVPDDLGTAMSTWVLPDGTELQVNLGNKAAVKKAKELGAVPDDLPTPEPENMPTADGLVRDLSGEERILSTWLMPSQSTDEGPWEEVQVDLRDVEKVKEMQELGAIPAPPDPEIRDLSDEERILSEMAGTRELVGPSGGQGSGATMSSPLR
jgi:hypothetical protein